MTDPPMTGGPADPPSGLASHEGLLERWRQTTRVAGRTYKRLTKHKKGLSLQFKMENGGPLVGTFSVPDDKNMRELAVVLRPLVHPASDLHYTKVFAVVDAIGNAQLQADTKALREAVEGMQRSNFVLDGTPIRGESALVTLLDRVFFCDDTQSIAFREQWNQTPEARDILWFVAYDYAINMARLLDYARERLGSNGAFKLVPRDALCIYCRTTTGSFTKVEHTLPEALGNTLSLLPRGWSCDACNDSSSQFEAAALESVPFSIVKVMMVNHSKDGKFTHGKFQGLHVTRTAPNAIQVNAFTKDAFKVVNLPDGTYKLTISASGKMDHIAIGRTLVKAALGGLALQHGRDFALDSRFDDARKFIATGKGLDARLFIAKQSKPAPALAVEFVNGDKAFGAVFTIYGTIYVVMLTSSQAESPPIEVADEYVVLDLTNPKAEPLQMKPRPSDTNRPDQP